MSAAKRIGKLLSWVIGSFGPLLAFYLFLHAFGLVPAIVSGIVTGLLGVAWGVWKHRKVSPFTVFVAASVVVFGFLDLWFRTGFFVKLEPALGNAATGLFFVGSVLLGKPVLIELAERAAGRSLDRAHGYLRGWTVGWGLFFFVRAACHVWLAYNVALEEALVLRAVLGPISFGAMFLIEMPVRYLVFGKRAFAKAKEKTDGEPVAAG